MYKYIDAVGCEIFIVNISIPDLDSFSVFLIVYGMLKLFSWVYLFNTQVFRLRPNDWVFLSSFAVYSYSKNLMMYSLVIIRLYISLYNLCNFLTWNLAFTQILAINEKISYKRKQYKSRETSQTAIQRYTTSKSTRCF